MIFVKLSETAPIFDLVAQKFKETGERAEVESADGRNERLVFRLSREDFVRKHGALFSKPADPAYE